MDIERFINNGGHFKDLMSRSLFNKIYAETMADIKAHTRVTISDIKRAGESRTNQCLQVVYEKVAGLAFELMIKQLLN